MIQCNIDGTWVFGHITHVSPTESWICQNIIDGIDLNIHIHQFMPSYFGDTYAWSVSADTIHRILNL